MAGIADVARLAGVSKATASRALSGGGSVAEATRRRVEAAADRIGYIASPDAASGRELRIQIAFHVDRRSAPIRRTAILPLPSAGSPREAIDRLFAEPLPLARAFRSAAPPGGRSELDEVAP